MKYFASHTFLAFTVSGFVLLITASMLAVVSSGLVASVSVTDVLKHALVTVPAVWTLVAFALAVVTE